MEAFGIPQFLCPLGKETDGKFPPEIPTNKQGIKEGLGFLGANGMKGMRAQPHPPVSFLGIFFRRTGKEQLRFSGMLDEGNG